MTALPDYWEHAKVELSKSDPVMAGIIGRYKGEGLVSRGDAFYTLCRSIVGQQVSVKAADSIWSRFAAHCEGLGGNALSPILLQRSSEEELRNCGLSRQKVAYLNEIANYFIEKNVTDSYFQPMADDEVLAELVSIKGVGKWTAEMFLIFHLLRPDVFPVDDIGLQRAIETHYMGGDKINKKQLVEWGGRWAPWRAVATWYLWRSLDPVPVEY